MRELTANEIEDVSGGMRKIMSGVGIGVLGNIVSDALKALWGSRASTGGGSIYDDFANGGISA